jgi:hypothetical protein
MSSPPPTRDVHSPDHTAADTPNYGELWRARTSEDEFGSTIATLWADEYQGVSGADHDDLVVIDPGNGFSYLFDLAGSLHNETRARSPRVIGVWGVSRPGMTVRDPSRMRGYPRPSRISDDRGHLVAHSTGGGYDINLVAMNAALNRGWSPEGRRFRAMERQAATAPGSFYFIRTLYRDDSDRPDRFEVGVQIGDTLQTNAFANNVQTTPPSPLAVLRNASPLPLDTILIASCVDESVTGDALFIRGWRSGTRTLTQRERCAVAGVTGHIAESVAELILDGLGWHLLWHHTGPGPHGVDLMLLTPDDKVIAVEVKGTLVPGRIPRLTRRQLAQMTAQWIDKTNNPAMTTLGLDSSDIYGAVIGINFPDLTWRCALTDDFTTFHAIVELDEVSDLHWLDND